MSCPRLLLSLVPALIAAGCAAAVPGYVPPSEKSDSIRKLAPTGGGFDQGGSYALSDQEQQLDCKRLTGSIQIKILQMREARDRKGPSPVITSMQQAAKPFVGGSDQGMNLAADRARDRARLEALNRQLAAKKCRTFDIEAELKPGNTADPAPKGR